MWLIIFCNYVWENSSKVQGTCTVCFNTELLFVLQFQIICSVKLNLLSPPFSPHTHTHTHTVCTAHCWHTRRSTSASLPQRASLSWWERWVTKSNLLSSFTSCLLCAAVFLHKLVSPFALQVPDLDALLTHVFSDLQEHPDKAEGTGQLLFEMCKGVRNMFHSCAANVSFFLNIYLKFPSQKPLTSLHIVRS